MMMRIGSAQKPPVVDQNETLHMHVCTYPFALLPVPFFVYLPTSFACKDISRYVLHVQDVHACTVLLRFTALPNGHNVMQGLAADNTDGPDAIVHMLQLAKFIMCMTPKGIIICLPCCKCTLLI